MLPTARRGMVIGFEPLLSVLSGKEGRVFAMNVCSESFNSAGGLGNAFENLEWATRCGELTVMSILFYRHNCSSRLDDPNDNPITITMGRENIWNPTC